ncbi:hypothetical protein C1645_833152 [Glomus cerebriforme]|uniref:Uncharacterized protein n=1 Tax=Glomus cerebriforme TaxID=658196 RepID=A0A397SC40_9GLOM|nr:hypothetical protein C1645_833152 [Glomus cerebriforme]
MIRAAVYFSYLNLKSATFNHRLNLVLEIKKWFSELFSPEWEGKMIIFRLMLKSETIPKLFGPEWKEKIFDAGIENSKFLKFSELFSSE